MAMPAKDYKKELRALYTGKVGRIDVVDVPPLAYLALEGKGDPATSFGPAMHALFSMAYPLKYTMRARDASLDYVVMPPEALYPAHADVYRGPREDWPWTLLVMQPVKPRASELESVRDKAREKGAPALVEDVELRTLKEGRCVQTLHVGPYDKEEPAILALSERAEALGSRVMGPHHEIYLSDPGRVGIEKAKTLLRMPLAKIARRVAASAR